MDLIHSKFLVHWTGKHLANESSQRKNQAYVEHLKKILNEGLYVRRPSAEEAQRERAVGNTWGEEHSFVINFGRLCFTEIRLSQAEAHAQSYGRLGIGFGRDFIMSRGGNPAFYIQNGSQGVAAEMFTRIRKYLGERSETGDVAAKSQTAHLEVLMGFTRTMGEPDSADLKYYEEMEWRILHSMGGERAGHFRPVQDGLWLMLFQPSDVKVIVFPDPTVKKLALEDSAFSAIFSQTSSPMLLTLDDCAHF